MHKTEILPITNMSLAELEAVCTSIGEPVYRAKQILSWIYNKGATDFDQMSNLPKDLRKKLAEKRQAFQTTVDTLTQTKDETEKFLVRLPDGNEIECVLLREGKRITVCVSTQVGCAMACRFCASGIPGLERNLSAGEIVEQALHVKNHFPPEERLTNIVFMGIGEPLANYDNVMKAIRIMNAKWGLGIGARHITISTVGAIRGIHRLAQEELQINLAISLHAPDDVTRSKIIPSNKKTGIKNIIAAAQEYFQSTGRDISFEYILIDGINASRQDAESLAHLLKGIQCNINLLPLNPIEEFNFRPPSREAIETFCKILKKSGLIVTLRRKKGDHINAACGQLRLQSINFYGKD
ncbi:MAG: Ribosomal RNA large subunit methyltransferase N [Candidatus Jettenia ecosi]|uniref:Probable dual-specificity RNA methyltransferase RlmN n=1 Tax=Candidatus Jettenia ecosi TaxID=2494326 RepID=A0A533QAS6_9BACT|nr:MAG: Ribosomal RNA large subunit methyltransferase N [Candidatus Jettenia ecosi]